MLIRSQQLHIRIPAGTKVLLRAGQRLGVVVPAPEAPEHAYRIRFPDGEEATCRRSDLTIYKQEQETIPFTADPETLLSCVVYKCVLGSNAYGLATEASDTDRRGFYLPPAELHWSLGGVPEQIETEQEEVYWEIEKFIRLALKANPNVLECLYSPLIEKLDPIAQELLERREMFLSKYAHRTFNAYVLSQFRKIEQDLRREGAIRWKHVMHLIRLLLSGVTILREGFVPLQVDAQRDKLLAIRRGEIPWPDIDQWRLSLHRELDDALGRTSLPEHPNFAAANDLLLRARRFATRDDYGSQ